MFISQISDPGRSAIAPDTPRKEENNRKTVNNRSNIIGFVYPYVDQDGVPISLFGNSHPSVDNILAFKPKPKSAQKRKRTRSYAFKKHHQQPSRRHE